MTWIQTETKWRTYVIENEFEHVASITIGERGFYLAPGQSMTIRCHEREEICSDQPIRISIQEEPCI